MGDTHQKKLATVGADVRHVKEKCMGVSGWLGDLLPQAIKICI